MAPIKPNSNQNQETLGTGSSGPIAGLSTDPAVAARLAGNLPATCVHDDGTEHPGAGTLPCPQTIWFRITEPYSRLDMTVSKADIAEIIDRICMDRTVVVARLS